VSRAVSATLPSGFSALAFLATIACSGTATLPSLKAAFGPPNVSATQTPDHPSSRDRVYTADQTSNTVSVIDAGTNTLLGTISLGDPRPNVLSPLYNKQIDVHGLGYSSDGSLLE
jgi:YVTN family beta-propeller protein